MVTIAPPLPPGCMTHGVGRRRALRADLLHGLQGQLVYSTFDWGIRDEDGYYFILGRTDDVINVAGHRLGTREIEEAVQAHPNIAEVRRGRRGRPAQGPDAAGFRGGEGRLEDRNTERARTKEVMADRGPAARRDRAARRVHFVTLLPKTRSGKLLRRSIQALAEGRDPGDLTTIEDPSALEQIKTGPAAMKTRPMLTLDDCSKISAAAEAEAKKNNWNVCIAILDDGGHLLHLARMDGASPANARIAMEKGPHRGRVAPLVAACGRSASRRGRTAMLGMPGITPVQGGLPIVVEGVCVGGDRRLGRAVPRGRADRRRGHQGGDWVSRIKS